MAALPETQGSEVVDLGRVRVRDLDPVLREETAAWRTALDWDFSSSAELVRRFVEVQALSGHALRVSGIVAGYAYYVAEEHKGLLGDLYILERHRTAENQIRLMTAVVESLMRVRPIRRIESQLMLLNSAPSGLLPASRYLNAFDRNFMVMDLRLAPGLPERPLPAGVVLDAWSDRRQDETAQVISAAYHGHIDSEINDQYRSLAGARRFLFNIVQYPGCGVFHQPSSWLAMAGNGRLCGVSLASMVAPDVGHITQICVTPLVKGRGVGYALLRRSLCSLARSGARKVSLTVTTANEDAVALYERVGFRTVRRFPALVWAGFA